MSEVQPRDSVEDSIARICEEVDRDSTVYFVVQFFGMHEIIESYENSSILVSQQFWNMVYDLKTKKTISCFFVFQDLRSIVGLGEIALETEKDPAAQEPFEIAVKWSKLATLSYNSFEGVRNLVEDEEDMNWEIKELDGVQARTIIEAMTACEEETVDSIRVKYEMSTNSTLNDEGEAHKTDEVENDVMVEEGATPSSDQATIDKREQPQQEGNPPSSEEVGVDRKRSRSQEKMNGNHGGAHQVDQVMQKRSRIPFDVTKMSYDQYCAKHYSYAIEMYRKEKALQYQQQQAARAAMMPMGGMPMHMMGQPMMGMNPAAMNMGMGPGMNMGMGMGGMGMGMYPGGVMPHMAMMSHMGGGGGAGVGMPAPAPVGYYPGQPAASGAQPAPAAQLPPSDNTNAGNL